MKHYDYIIAGAGCAGLSLLTRMIASGNFREKRILLLDKAPKTANDRTWCFWEKGTGFFESIVHTQWKQLYFHSNERLLSLHINPYTYKMVRGIDFYNYCFDKINAAGIEVQYGNIGRIENSTNSAQVTVNGEIFTADYIFSSIVPDGLAKQPGKHYLLQHFKGWLVEMDKPCFDTNAATIMDFRITQQYGDCFMYVLPLTDKRAMIECTFFSKEVQDAEVYNHILRNYILTHFPGNSYTIHEEENGIIPMTNHSFKKHNGRIIYLGTAGGYTKGSSGYTFQFIQSHTRDMVQQLLSTGSPYVPSTQPRRFNFYDTVLLSVLSKGDVRAAQVFEQLFLKNDPVTVLKFLDNNTNLKEDIKIISSLPTLPFFTAAMKEINLLKRRHENLPQYQLYANH